MFSKEMYDLGANRSCIRDLFEYGLKQKMIVGPENVYDYSLGNPSVPPPERLTTAIRHLIDQESPLALHGYSSAAGFSDVKQIISKELNDRYSINTVPEEFFFTCGAAPALTAVLRALAVRDSEIIVIYPCFPEYKVFIESNGSRMVTVSPDYENFQIKFDELEEKINEHTQAVLINTPNNPSGVVYSIETLHRLGDLLRKKSAEVGHPIYIISDEPYRELVYDGKTVPFIPSLYRDTVVTYSFSKSLSVPGDRIGYFFIPLDATDGKDLFLACAGAARSMGHVCAPSFMQKIISKSIFSRPDIAAYDKNRTTLYNALTEFGYKCAKPEGAFYILAEAPGGDAMEFSERAKLKNLFLVPADDFGCPGYFRLCTCVSYDMIIRSLPIFKELIDLYK